MVSCIFMGAFSTTFHKKCGTGVSLEIVICLRSVAGVRKGMLTVKYLNSNNSSLSC